MSDGGELRIHTLAEHGKAVIKVSDTGVGIDEEDIKHIFDPYFSTKEVGSSGLGLSIVYGLVTNAGGKIEVESKRGHGTTFTIFLPSNDGERPKEDVSPVSRGSLRNKRLKMLAVDDEPQIAELIGLMLKDLGHEVVSCNDAKEALNLIKTQEFDVVLTDLGMPVINGWRIAKEVKEKAPQVPVVLMTGWGAGYEDRDLKDKGVDKVISKPFRLKNIVDVLTELFPQELRT
jgi:CheY-like chemotaxis protein